MNALRQAFQPFDASPDLGELREAIVLLVDDLPLPLGDQRHDVVVDQHALLVALALSLKVQPRHLRQDLGGLREAYQEVAKRLGIINENEPLRGTGPVLVK